MRNSVRRVGFRTVRSREASPLPPAWADLAAILRVMEATGASPIESDGRPAGNAALLLPGPRLLVSRSGRNTGDQRPEDFVVVRSFSPENWTAEIAGAGTGIEPTSDTPLYWLALVEAPAAFGWRECPTVAAHGHFRSGGEEAALRKGIPASSKETSFSSPEDREALKDLMKANPYPLHRIWVRKGHGWFILGSGVDDVLGSLSGRTGGAA